MFYRWDGLLCEASSILHCRVWYHALSAHARAIHVLDVRASSSSPRLCLCQIAFLSHPPTAELVCRDKFILNQSLSLFDATGTKADRFGIQQMAAMKLTNNEKSLPKNDRHLSILWQNQVACDSVIENHRPTDHSAVSMTLTSAPNSRALINLKQTTSQLWRLSALTELSLLHCVPQLCMVIKTHWYE